MFCLQRSFSKSLQYVQFRNINRLSHYKINNKSSALLPLPTMFNQRLATQLLQIGPTRWHSVSVHTVDNPSLSAVDFENICEETLDGLTEYFEELIELDDSIKDPDISYSSGVLTITLAPKCIYVINKQSPNKQIWLSSPTSGPKRFDFDTKGQFWVYKHTGETLHQVLQAEIPKVFKIKEIDFSRCCYSKL